MSWIATGVNVWAPIAIVVVVIGGLIFGEWLRKKDGL